MTTVTLIRVIKQREKYESYKDQLESSKRDFENLLPKFEGTDTQQAKMIPVHIRRYELKIQRMDELVYHLRSIEFKLMARELSRMISKSNQSLKTMGKAFSNAMYGAAAFSGGLKSAQHSAIMRKHDNDIAIIQMKGMEWDGN